MIKKEHIFSQCIIIGLVLGSIALFCSVIIENVIVFLYVLYFQIVLILIVIQTYKRKSKSS